MKSMYLAGLTGIGLLTGFLVACGDSSGTGSGVHPGCDDVSQFIAQCSDVTAVLGAPSK